LTGDGRAGELRVLIVTDQYEPMVGGVPTVTRELARGLAERGHAVEVLAPSSTGRSATAAGRGGSGRGAGAAPGGRLTVARRGSVRWPWYEDQRLGFLSRAAAGELIGGFAPDVVHVHSPLTLGATARAGARRRRVPVVYTNHYLPANVHPTVDRADRAGASRRPAAPGDPAVGSTTPATRVSSATRATAAAVGGAANTAAGALFDVGFYGYLTAFANRCDRVTAPTATALLLLRDHGLRAPSQVVSNGVDLDVYSPGAADESLRSRYALPAGRPLILSVGRLSPEKRADVLIEALATQDVAGTVLALAGSGPDEGRLRDLAARRGVAERVRFLGFIPGTDLPGLYRLADVFAIASEAELQSLVTMEAMASGLPVVAVNAGALGELVHAGENGFLARPGRSADVAGSLDLLCRDRALRARMSKSGLRIIADHDRHRLLARWESIYSALAARGSTSEEKDRQR
jgi:glycosyltransferase involved in cell wall biosynthesis